MKGSGVNIFAPYARGVDFAAVVRVLDLEPRVDH